MDLYGLFHNPAAPVFVVGAVAIVVIGAVKIMTLYFRHRERVEMIRNGMHPDAHTDENAET